MAYTAKSRNWYERLRDIEAVIVGDGAPCFDGVNHVSLITGNGAPTNGTVNLVTPADSGSGVGVCGPGSLYIDYANAKVYVQTGTIDNVYWLILGNQSS